MKNTLYLFLFWRLFLFLPPLLAEKFLRFRSGYEYINGNVWANFDGIHYLSIAANGYTIYNSAFFPLYPLSIKIFSVGESSIQFWVGLVLSSLFIFLGLIFFYRLLRLDFNNKLTTLIIISMLVFPTSFFFAAIYSESLFFLLLVLSLYFARERNWLLSSIFAGFLTATRLVGVAILPALLYEFWKSEKTLFNKKVSPLLLAPSGLALFMWYSFVNWQNPFHFVEAQQVFANERSVHLLVFPAQTVFRYFKILSQVPIRQYEWWVALLELSVFIFTCVLLFAAWKKKVRASYLIFAVIAFLIPILTGTFTALPRYVLPAFPIFIALVLIKNKWIRLTYFAVSTILLFVIFMLFSKGYFIS